LIAISIALFLLNSHYIFNAYAVINEVPATSGSATSGSATSGSATSGNAISGGATCYGNTCNYYIYTGPAISGSATSGNAAGYSISGGQSGASGSSDTLSSLSYNDVKLTHIANKINPSDPSSRYEVRVWVEAPTQVLSNIEKVLYNPQPAKYFPDGNITTNSITNNFATTWNVWGTFPLTAKVYFKDGNVRDLYRYISFY